MDECGLLPSTSESKGKESTKGKGKGKGKGRRNPNEEALRDVGRFKLGLSAGGRVEDDCWYYIKPRLVPRISTPALRVRDFREGKRRRRRW